MIWIYTVPFIKLNNVNLSSIAEMLIGLIFCNTEENKQKEKCTSVHKVEKENIY